MRFLLALLFMSPVMAVDVFFAPSKDVPEAIEKAIDGAESTLDVAIYSFSDTRLQKKLKDAARRGGCGRIGRFGRGCAVHLGQHGTGDLSR
ncbi:hypothetical protein LF1_14610 [Rubripirellula obstinata]|uniref:Phospholipase D-like domain-containing protein n=1 Tax=Rubripirellula obstinata TaxID=406547 RepID=A0A5B1CCT1_9BACT|nr:hypothetical protein [Rubripirellula obstinata]KAA1258937.1 hypothetical protein LF1_14610 [Rubripirellula obstinata]